MSSPAGSTNRSIGPAVPAGTLQALESEYLRLALDSHAIVSIAEPGGGIIYVNEKFCEVSGYSRVELLGSNHRIVKSGMHPPEFFANMWETISSGRIWQGEVCNRAKSGRLYWVESTIVPFLDANGLPYQYVSIRTNVTAQKRSERLLSALATAEAQTIAEEPPAEIFPKLLMAVLPLVGCEFGFIGECSENDLPALNLLAITDHVWDDACRAMHARVHDGHLHFDDIDSPFGRSLSVGQAVVMNLPSAEGLVGLDNFLALPLMRGEATLGMIGLGNRHGGFDDRIVQFIQPLAATCGSMIASLRFRRQRERITEALVLARDRAEQASHAKSEFLSRMSHELRTPLNAIIGFGQLLATDPVEPPTPDQSESINQILTAGRHLLELINEVLDLARIESGRLHLTLVNVALPSLLDECLLLLQPLARERTISLHSSVAANGLTIAADRTRLKQVLINVLANAIKYNQADGEVHVQLEERPEQVGIVITDTGRGFAQSEQDHIFQPFTRLGSAEEEEGTGIGLAITRHLMELMGGQIELVSAPGHGSTFTLWLRRGSGDEEPMSSPAPRKSQRDVARRRILYIEDDHANRLLVEKALSRNDTWEVITAETGNEGLMLARHLDPDLILLDLELPDSNGFDLKRQIDAMPHRRKVSIVAISAHANPDEVKRGREAGFAAYVTKPLDIDNLPAVLQAHLTP